MRPLGGPVKLGARPRWALAIAVCAGTMCLSYAGQRLGAWGLDEPGPITGAVSVYTPYFWRLGLAALHGLVAGAVAGLAVTRQRAEAGLQPLGRALALVIALCALSMVLVP